MRRLFFYVFFTLIFIGRINPVPVNAAVDAAAGQGNDIDSSALFFKGADEVQLPVVMYHLVTRNGKYIGRYGITPEALESDLKYLSDNGYSTVVMKDVIEFVGGGAHLPEKPVMLTFDDGNSSDYTYVLPLLRKYNMKAVLSVMGKQADEFTAAVEKNSGAVYPNLTWPQIRELAQSGHAEIQSHAYNLHGGGGAGIRSGESAGGYKERLRNDLTRLQNRCAEELSITPNTLTYPLGVFNKGSEALIREMGFAASFSCTEGMNIIKRNNPEGLFLLKRCIRPTGKDIADVLNGIKAK